MAERVITQLVTNIMTRQPTRVTAAETKVMMLDWMVWPIRSTSLVTRERMSPKVVLL